MFRLPTFLFLFCYLAWRVPRLLPKRIWKWRWTIRALMTIGFALGFGVHLYSRRMDPDPGTFFLNLWAWTGLPVFGLLASILLILVPIDVVLALYLTGRFTWRKLHGKAPPAESTRRAFIRETAGAAVVGVPLFGTIAGTASAAKGARVKETVVPVRNLHPDLEGLRIAQISDLHVALTILEDYVTDVVDQTLSTRPDLIAVTGDMVDGTVDRLGKHVAPLSRLKAPLGVFYVTGNHEYYSGAGPWIERFVSMGMTHLKNEHRLLRRGRARLLVAGVPDPVGSRFDPTHVPDVEAAVRNAPESDLRILLAHRPQACHDAVRAGIDLQLSGHTHAGQFFPWSLYVPFAHPYVRGLNRHENRLWVYVNAGTGYWGPPNRFTVPSEITLLRLTRSG